MSRLTLIFVLFTTVVFGQNVYNIIPRPDTLEARSGQFFINSETKIVLQTADPSTASIAKILADQLAVVTGTKMFIEVSTQQQRTDTKTKLPAPIQDLKNTIVFSRPNILMNEENYGLTIDPNTIYLSASSAKGYFYALQTLFQLLPPEVFESKKVNGMAWTVPAVRIVDKPRYQYRGLMLDVGRHFMPISFIKKMIDQLALHKMNTLHWHLTEDQGWRIEIKKYPKLTQIGSVREETILGKLSYTQPITFDGKPHSGFYTQDEIRDLVAYAESKFITIIPEIEMPGHALAALAAYPELGCSGGPYTVGKNWGVIEDVFCPYENTFKFLEDVLSEVIELFPSKYIHIGGDECPKITWKQSKFCQDLIKQQKLKDEHELQSYFIKRIDTFLSSKGKKLIGWDEILEGGLSPNATVMSWRGVQGGIDAAKQNHDVIMTPNTHVYIDYYQSHPVTEPLAIGGFLPLEKVYSYEPTPSELNAEQAKRVLGTQINLWTEYVPTPEQAEYMIFPRLSAISEVAWSQASAKNWNDFARRIENHFKIFDYQKINYSKAIYDIKETLVQNKAPQSNELKLESYLQGAEVRYTIDGRKPTAQSAIFPPNSSITFNKLTLVRAMVFRNGQALGNEFAKTYRAN
jgi:hexosaminidase